MPKDKSIADNNGKPCGNKISFIEIMFGRFNGISQVVEITPAMKYFNDMATSQ
ncbi:MAG: hypothetical protein JEZ07_03690 [Phycisphaerae bacterium]|nr:hypothetical protein [Phycisphaerae bacterium]